MCMVDDDAGWKVFRSADRKARKEWKCDECGRMIRAGETYRYATGVGYDWGGWQTFHTCAHCQAATQWLVTACDGYLYTMVLQDLREHWDESELYRSPMLRSLIDNMAARWHDGTDPVPVAAEVRAAVPEVAA